MVYQITATPYDLMVQLDDLGVDFTKLTDYDLFIMSFEGFKGVDTSLVFGELDLSLFDMAISEDNSTIIFRNRQNGVVIDRSIHDQICKGLRKIHHFKRNNKKPANAEAKKFMIDRARVKLKRRKGRVEDSQLDEWIVALVNTEQFNYNYESVLDISIYQFMESVYQVSWIKEYDNRMGGIYAGTVSPKDLDPKDLNWLSHDKM